MKSIKEMYDTFETIHQTKVPRKIKKAFKYIEEGFVCTGFNYEGGEEGEDRYIPKEIYPKGKDYPIREYRRTKWMNKVITALNKQNYGTKH